MFVFLRGTGNFASDYALGGCATEPTFMQVFYELEMTKMVLYTELITQRHRDTEGFGRHRPVCLTTRLFFVVFVPVLTDVVTIVTLRWGLVWSWVWNSCLCFALLGSNISSSNIFIPPFCFVDFIVCSRERCTSLRPMPLVVLKN